MGKIILMCIFFIMFSVAGFGQRITYKDLKGGKWKVYNLPDSAYAIPGDTIKRLVVNIVAKFVDSNTAEVSYNGSYYKKQHYKIDTVTGLIYIAVRPDVEDNASKILWVLKYVNKETMKLQMSAKLSSVVWDNDETWYNTYTLTFYKD